MGCFDFIDNTLMYFSGYFMKLLIWLTLYLSLHLGFYYLIFNIALQLDAPCLLFFISRIAIQNKHNGMRVYSGNAEELLGPTQTDELEVVWFLEAEWVRVCAQLCC